MNQITNTPRQRGLDDTVWATIIQRLAGPNDRFPGRPVYCMGSLWHMDESWLQAVAKQARERGWEVLDGDGDLYLVGPRTRQERAMAESWRKLKPGDRVRVARGISEMERRLVGREFVIDRFTKPHGYAVIMDEHGPWWVHPEALEKIDG